MIMILLLLFFLTFLLTGLYRHYALSRNIMDIPNHRSSHIVPTPRGGGGVFVVVFLMYLLFSRSTGEITVWDLLAFGGAGLLVAGLGFIDDLYSIPSIWRLLGHFIACGFALFCLGGMAPIITFGLSQPILVVLVNGFALLYLVWCLNLYNFMDGIDGLAAVEGITVCLGGALIYGLHGSASMMMLPLVLTAVVAGFLCWNFPRARIFMGDAGSGFLGLMIGLFSIQAANVRVEFFWSWLIVLGVFIVDATVTLLLRVFEGSRIDEAHRNHAYQRATDLFQRHVPVTMGVLAINFVWLLPLAVLVGSGRLNGMIGLLIAYLPLVVFVFQFRGGSNKEI